MLDDAVVTFAHRVLEETADLLVGKALVELGCPFARVAGGGGGGADHVRVLGVPEQDALHSILPCGPTV